jgi:hypothetical protein
MINKKSKEAIFMARRLNLSIILFTNARPTVLLEDISSGLEFATIIGLKCG